VELWPNVVVIALGTNDYVSDVSLRKFAAGYRAALNKLSSVATVVCVTPYRRSDRSEARPNAVGLLPNAYREAVRSVCEERGRIVLDGFEALPSESYLADGLHPNDAGHQRIAEWLEQRLIEILDRTERARVDPG